LIFFTDYTMDWNRVKTFEELRKGISRFLAGKINTSPIHCGPLDPESSVIINNLRKLVDDSIVPLTSQPQTNFLELKQVPFLEGVANDEKSVIDICARAEFYVRGKGRKLIDTNVREDSIPVTWIRGVVHTRVCRKDVDYMGELCGYKPNTSLGELTRELYWFTVVGGPFFNDWAELTDK
jgi:hypothetical protein